MSIADLADLRLQRTESRQRPITTTEEANQVPPKTRAEIPTGVLNTLTAWIPAETVTAYVAIQPALDDLVTPEGQNVCTADYGDRWWLFWLMLVLTIALVPVYVGIKCRNSSTQFKWPVVEIAISGVAFTLWVLALPDSPFNDFCGVREWHAVAALVAGGGTLAAITVLLKTPPPWSDARANDAPSSP